MRTIADNTALRTTEVYLNVLKNEAIFDLAKENLTIHQRIFEQLKLRSESGVSSQADMNQIQARLSLTESNLIIAEQNLADAHTNYLAVIGKMPITPTRPEVDESLVPDNMIQAEHLALKTYGEIL